ncbi:MAG: pentapeptide repeat-containing protein [Cyanobacteria bacterium P01_F01_bin.116]
MVESTSVPETTSHLSTVERLRLVQTLNALPSAQFEELLVALNPPNGNIPDDTASQAKRSAALFQWIESPIGPGITELEGALGLIIATESHVAQTFLSFAISGKISSETVTEVRAIVELLRKKTGDYSIDVAFFKEGSINIILTGLPEGLKKLQELFEASELDSIGGKQVNAVHTVGIATADARKALLVQALKLASNSNLDFAKARAIIQLLAKVLDSARNNARNSARAIENINSTIFRAIDIDHAIDHARDSDSDLISARTVINMLATTIDFIHVRVIDGAIDRAIGHARTLVNTLSGARDLFRDSVASVIDSALSDALANASDIEDILSLAIITANRIYQDLTEAEDILANNELYQDLADTSVSTIDMVRNQQLDLERADLTNANLRNIDLRYANLTEASFEGADLTNAVLTGANVKRTNLKGANVTRTIFGENENLTDADKRDLKRRGAIFQAPPSSDVSSLIPS